MIVHLTEGCLVETETTDTRLLRLFLLARSGRFKVRAAVVPGSTLQVALERRLQRFTDDLADTCRHVLRQGLRQPDYAPRPDEPEPEILLVAGKGEAWPLSWGPPLRRALDDETLGLLERPLRVLVENERADFAFLRRASPTPWARRIEQALKERWIEPDHCGGLPELRKKVEDLVADDPERRLKSWAIFDSDAAAPGEPSRDATDTVEVCALAPVRHWVLRRRAIENYIPREALYDWAGRVDRLAKDRHAWVGALFKELSPTQRWHYHMKGGFQRHGSRSAAAKTLYGRLLDAKGSGLWEGAPISARDARTHLSEIWSSAEYAVSSEALEREGVDDELTEVLQSLFGSL